MLSLAPMNNVTLSAAALLSSLLFVASGSQAAIRTPGTACKAQDELLALMYQFDLFTGINVDDGPVNLMDHTIKTVCPIPAEVSIGTQVDFTIRVTDNSPREGVSCRGAVIDRDGDLVAVTSTGSSGGTPEGEFTISKSLTIGSSETTSYVVLCTIPATGFSWVDSIKTE